MSSDRDGNIHSNPMGQLVSCFSNLIIMLVRSTLTSSFFINMRSQNSAFFTYRGSNCVQQSTTLRSEPSSRPKFRIAQF
eukprot:3109771-Karenia_brevis.AAC.1